MIQVLVIVLSFFYYSYATIPEKVLICGVCQNVEKALPKTIKIIEKIGRLFTDYQVFVYENNSTDMTKTILANWSRKNSRVKIKLEDVCQATLKQSYTNKDYIKPEGVARARNIVLDHIMKTQYDEYPFIIWIDMDFTIEPRYAGIVEVFQTTRQWDAIFAYGMDRPGQFWDWFALRDDLEPFGPELLGHYEWYAPGKIRNFKQSDDWYPVYSAFGGCGIYKRASIVGCRYAAIVTPDLEVLYKQIIQRGLLVNHPMVLQYIDGLAKLTTRHYIPAPKAADLKKITDYRTTGITLQQGPDALVWRMNTFTYQYPAICEHVPFHASMIVNGHDKLFINPRMIFTYGD